jgi:hypothetical protein
MEAPAREDIALSCLDDTGLLGALSVSAMLRIGGIVIWLIEIDLDVVDGVASVSVGLKRFGFTKGCGDSGKGLTPWEFDEDVLVIHS